MMLLKTKVFLKEKFQSLKGIVNFYFIKLKYLFKIFCQISLQVPL
jgi:hypothetical protein